MHQQGSIQFVYRAKSDVGRVRDNNEDALIEMVETGLFGVCDGLGGHAAGEVASSIAASTLKEFLEDSSEVSDEVLRLGIEEANARILNHQKENPEHVGMGTTLSACWLSPEKTASSWIAHVGDSRIYLQRGEELKQITEDHSPVFRLYKQGLLTKEQMHQHPQKNLLDRSLGVFDTVKADCFSLPLDQGDLILICTDGLTDALVDAEIKSILSDRSLDDAADDLIAAANHKGGMDNITLVLIQIEKIEE